MVRTRDIARTTKKDGKFADFGRTLMLYSEAVDVSGRYIVAR
jgi:hypothetical protein